MKCLSPPPLRESNMTISSLAAWLMDKHDGTFPVRVSVVLSASNDGIHPDGETQ